MRDATTSVDKPAVAIVAITAAITGFVGLSVMRSLPEEIDGEQLGPSPDACYGLACALRDMPELAAIALVIVGLAALVLYISPRRRGESSE